jgi:hypothetical protein
MGGKKLPGRWCWCCGGRSSNEGFSRKLRVCHRCAKLGREEIAYLQHVRDIDRLLTFRGRVKKHQEKTFARYLAHPDPRVRAYAEERRAEPVRERALEATAASAEIALQIAAYQIGFDCEEGEEESEDDGEELDVVWW